MFSTSLAAACLERPKLSEVETSVGGKDGDPNWLRPYQTEKNPPVQAKNNWFKDCGKICLKALLAMSPKVQGLIEILTKSHILKMFVTLKPALTNPS